MGVYVYEYERHLLMSLEEHTLYTNPKSMLWRELPLMP